jgi:hypothetical protein
LRSLIGYTTLKMSGIGNQRFSARCMVRHLIANLFRAKLIPQRPEVSAEVRHTVHVRADGGIGEVAAVRLLKHELTKVGSERILLLSASQLTPPAAKAGSAARGGVRRRGSFVQVTL